jgi:hypothetical protein
VDFIGHLLKNPGDILVFSILQLILEMINGGIIGKRDTISGGND